MTVKLVEFADSHVCAKCIEALQDAIDAKPDSVFVLYRKDGKVHYRSVFTNRLEDIGAFEVAKQEFWSA